jgi:hypothetical protein
MIGKPDFLRIEKITGLESLEASAVELQKEGKTAEVPDLMDKAADFRVPGFRSD